MCLHPIYYFKREALLKMLLTRPPNTHTKGLDILLTRFYVVKWTEAEEINFQVMKLNTLETTK